jgi:hypothetical protein
MSRSIARRRMIVRGCPEPGLTRGSAAVLVDVSIRFSARVQRAGDFSLLVQRKVTKRKHVRAGFALGFDAKPILPVHTHFH